MIEARRDITGTAVLDLFAGSGALGFEALSRGAASADFVETNPLVLGTIRANAENLDIMDRCGLFREDAQTFLRRNLDTRYELILADPPYGLPYTEDLPGDVAEWLAPDGLFVLEHDRRMAFSDRDRVLATRSHGGTSVTLFGGRGVAQHS